MQYVKFDSNWEFQSLNFEIRVMVFEVVANNFKKLETRMISKYSRIANSNRILALVFVEIFRKFSKINFFYRFDTFLIIPS